jgi:hypothetical protein
MDLKITFKIGWRGNERPNYEPLTAPGTPALDSQSAPGWHGGRGWFPRNVIAWDQPTKSLTGPLHHQIDLDPAGEN